jgi:hypothetical protein
LRANPRLACHGALDAPEHVTAEIIDGELHLERPHGSRAGFFRPAAAGAIASPKGAPSARLRERSARVSRKIGRIREGGQRRRHGSRGRDRSSPATNLFSRTSRAHVRRSPRADPRSTSRTNSHRGPRTQRSILWGIRRAPAVGRRDVEESSNPLVLRQRQGVRAVRDASRGRLGTRNRTRNFGYARTKGTSSLGGLTCDRARSVVSFRHDAANSPRDLPRRPRRPRAHDRRNHRRRAAYAATTCIEAFVRSRPNILASQWLVWAR